MRSTISVVVLTHNRAQMMAECLEALRTQTRPPDEIVVVDNASTDITRQVLDGLLLRAKDLGAQPAPPLKVVEGVSDGGWAAARNRGVCAATGEWVAFTDDDCLPDKEWVRAIESLAHEDYDAVGGWVEPAQRLRYPWWWHAEMAWAVGLSVPGLRGPLAGSVYYPQTANWAARREVLLKEPFQEIEADFEKDRNIYRAGREDAELWRRLRRNGYRAHVDPRMVVQHRIGPQRLRFRNVLCRAYQDGVALQRREPYRELAAKAVDDLVSLPRQLVLGIWAKRDRPWRRAAWHLVWAARQWGQCVEFRRRKGWIRGSGTLAWIALTSMFNRTVGLFKQTHRRTGIAFLRLRRPAPKYAARSVVVAAAGYLGDMVLLHAFIAGLRQQRPEVTITLLTNLTGEALFAHEPAVNRVVVLDTEESTPRAAQALIRSALRACRAELILVPYFHGISPSALFSRSRARVVTFSEHVGFPRRWWYDRADTRISKPVGRSEAVNLHLLFGEAGLRDPVPEVPLAFLSGEANEVLSSLRVEDLDRFNLVVLAPGSAKEEKLWDEERWAEIARYLAKEYELRIALVGIPREEALCRRIADLSGPGAQVWCDLGVRRLALALGASRLVVCSDNGVKHLAAAMETPTLTLYGPTDERQWGVMHHPERHGAVRACAWDLTDEERIGLPANHQMLCISTERVIRALDEMLAEL